MKKEYEMGKMSMAEKRSIFMPVAWIDEITKLGAADAVRVLKGIRNYIENGTHLPYDELASAKAKSFLYGITPALEQRVSDQKRKGRA